MCRVAGQRQDAASPTYIQKILEISISKINEPINISMYEVNNETIFYDAKCGIPLFQLGKRELVNWTASSIAHGWPSFRDSEVGR